ncbi:nucleocapsid protein [Mammarenavirus whitewaterense]|uniref:Nucleoprotein n=3 Tax=Whitewater Arroyo mammarenavirus (isolate Rat/United States/AV 9310135/1995) TaxID=3052331 RepID=NCAP_WWAVU|nr:nucleocapsid protein [Mammarenavirus whitewaterense]Q91PB2.1 RecName: Full=Nucleoprotein; AltName: Full=Nucleocapsid protein; AltName: Full=Protein N [Mammarenavirus whitewaterense]AAK60498.1 nucleocapsid protein [Mammarenavirus whitewaterense]
MSDQSVPSFRWTQSLRRGLSAWTTSVKADVLNDTRALLSGLDFAKVASVQRMMRRVKRDDSDLVGLRDLNKEVDSLMIMKSNQKNMFLKVGSLSKDELMELSSDLEKLKQKVQRTERVGNGTGQYQGNLSNTQLTRRSEILQLVGIQRAGLAPTGGVVKIWDIKDPSLLVNQFGSVPAVTISCMTEQGGESLNDVVQGLTDLGLLYTAKYPNLNDLKALTTKHPSLNIITQEESQINISGYNLSLSAAVKAGACLIDGGNMLETIKIEESTFTTVIKTLLEVKNKEKMFVSPTPGQRNPYENVLYKLCLSGDGWPYIASRSQIKGRAWDNTVVEFDTATVKEPIPIRNGGAPLLTTLKPEIENQVKRSVESLLINDTTWIDIEGPPNDPVEFAIYQPESQRYIHCYRRPNDIKSFKDQSKYCHGILLKDVENARPGLISSIIRSLPKSMVFTAQGADDIRKLFDMHGRQDLKIVDVKLSAEESRIFEDLVWKRFEHLCDKHKGIVIKSKKKGSTPATTNAHCALLDGVMFSAVISGSVSNEKPKRMLPIDLLFREPETTVVL